MLSPTFALQILFLNKLIFSPQNGQAGPCNSCPRGRGGGATVAWLGWIAVTGLRDKNTHTHTSFCILILSSNLAFLLSLLCFGHYFGFSVLGNHDYRGDVEAQLDPIFRKMDSRWLCMRSFIVNSGN